MGDKYLRRLGHGVSHLLGGRLHSYDNALAEAQFSIFKTELFRNPAVLDEVGGHWKGLDDLEIATCAWISWFNEERIHGELDDQTPSGEVEEHYRVESQAAAA